MTYVTIPGFEQLTAQEVFDISAKHILANGPSTNDEGRCVYGGSGCAAAPFLAPGQAERLDVIDEYGVNWDSLWEGNEVPPAHQGLVADLQGAHDRATHRASFDDSWLLNVAEVAHSHHLSMDVFAIH